MPRPCSGVGEILVPRKKNNWPNLSSFSNKRKRMKTTVNDTGASFGMPLQPAYYAEQLVDKLGFLRPPISEAAALDYLGLRRREFPGSEYFVPVGLDDDDKEDEGIIQTRMWTVLPHAQRQSQSKRRHRKPVDAAL